MLCACDHVNDRVRLSNQRELSPRKNVHREVTLGAGSVWDVASSSALSRNKFLEGENEKIYILLRETLKSSRLFSNHFGNEVRPRDPMAEQGWKICVHREVQGLQGRPHSSLITVTRVTYCLILLYGEA
jgi:hypothetical protein